MFSYVLCTCDVENVETTVCLEGFRHARAAAARMCPAWYYLTRMVALRTRSKEFEVRAKVAREAPMDRNVEKPLVFERFSESARVDFQIFGMRKSYVFICFIEVVA